ncbi:hypothetical protein CON22_25830 [Bacillus cereus]|nr:hypothetical protein CON22_25830 [Bacillus cereus]
MDIGATINQGQGAIKMSDAQINLLKSIYHYKISFSKAIVLTEKIQLIESKAEEGLGEISISFEKIDIKWAI